MLARTANTAATAPKKAESAACVNSGTKRMTKNWMKVATAMVLGLLILAPCVMGQTPARTARDYFTELRDANAFNKYYAKYVCFPDDDGPHFAVMSTLEDVADAMSRIGDKRDAATIKKAGSGLYVETFYKGVSNGDPILYDKVNGEYQIDFDAPIHHGRMVYRINWKTGRYRLQIYALDHNKGVPVADGSGKCELIHPYDTPSVLAEK
jgi:hypothetical protein